MMDGWMAIAIFKNQQLVTISPGAMIELIVHNRSLFRSVRIPDNQLTIPLHPMNTANPGQFTKMT